MLFRERSLGEATTEPTWFERILETPAVERSIVDPLYVTVERKAVASIKDRLGPWVIGVGIGLVLVNLYLARGVSYYRRRIRASESRP